MVLGVADDEGSMILESVSAAEVLEAIMESAGIGYESTVIDQTTTSVAVAEVDTLFQLPKPDRKPSVVSKRRKLTSHRILTSREILQEKREAKQKKEQDLKVKEERKQARKIKQEQKCKTKFNAK